MRRLKLKRLSQFDVHEFKKRSMAAKGRKTRNQGKRDGNQSVCRSKPA
jgi:hypothetical protein